VIKVLPSLEEVESFTLPAQKPALLAFDE